MQRSGKKKNEHLIYESEARYLDELKQKMHINENDPAALGREIDTLMRAYEKLLRQVEKITKVGDANQRKLLLAHEKIENQKRELNVAYEKLELLARTDPLTGLSNRRDFLEKVENEKIRFQRSHSSFCIVLSDIDNFKSFNDRYGHDCGDYVLKGVGDCFSQTIRKQDHVGRWGGEEFIMLLPDSEIEGGFNTADKVREAVASKMFAFDSLRLSVTMTFGVAVYNGDSTIDEIVKLADERLYEGKKQGKNCVIYKKLV